MTESNNTRTITTNDIDKRIDNRIMLCKVVSSIFKTIIKNHMFIDGNKRTAVEMFKSFCNKSGIKNAMTDGQLMEVATKVAVSEVDDVLEISKLLIK